MQASRPNEALPHIPELDGIRGIAVLAVILLHFHAPFAAGRPLGPVSVLLEGGWAGVDIFFVLSGYLITSILLATRDSTNYFSAFYARRALRILPLYSVALAFYFWIELPLAHRHGLVTGFRESEQWWYWAFLGNWRQGLGFNDGAGVAHFWSLAIEEQFYIAFAVVVLVVRRRALAWTCVGMIVLSISLRAVLDIAGHLPLMALRLTPLHLDPIGMGALLACSERARVWASRWAWALVLVGLLGVYLPLPVGWGVMAAGLGAAGAVAVAVTRGVGALRAPWLRSMGKYSYGIYVIHAFVSGLVANAAKRHHGTGFLLLCLVGGPAVSIGLAWVSWHVMESRFLRWKSRFPYHEARPESVARLAA